MEKDKKQLEREELESQKAALEADVEAFRQAITEVIQHTTLDNDKFRELYVFGNYYQLAIDAYPDLKTRWENYRDKHRQYDNEVRGVADKAKDVLGKYGVSIESHMKSKDESVTHVIVNGQTVYTTNGHIAPSSSNYSMELRYALNDMQSGKHADLIREREGLQRELDDLATKKMFFKQRKEHEIKEKIKKIDAQLSDYRKNQMVCTQLESAIDAMDALKEEEAMSSGKQKDLQALIDTEGKTLRNILDDKSTSVIALACIGVYKRNYDLLRMMPEGAKPALHKLLSEGAEYYTRGAISRIVEDPKKFDEWLKIDKISSELHEEWRKTRKNEDGSFEPRWKKVVDPMLEARVKKMDQLPPNLRYEDGVLMQDIANTSFGDLCLNYQLENFEAAQVVFEIAQTHYTHDQAGMVGDIIHKEWLKRNPWAAGSDLDVSFSDLIRSEKFKDLIHYDIAKGVVNEAQLEL